MENKNILFFLTPKSQIAYCLDTFTLRQVVEKMDFHHYAAMPILNKKGKYIGAITEGDLLWTIREKNELNYQASEKIPLKEIKLRRTYNPVKISSTLESLMDLIENQNFVPVVDDNDIFIGIVTRKSVLKEFERQMKEEE